MSMGRDRVAKQGKWTGGPVPFGYDLDAKGCPQHSARLVPGLDRPEAAIAVEVFERIAAGHSATAEARRLQALGVPCERRYGGKDGKVYAPTGTWRPGRICQMVKNPLYEGRHLLRSRYGTVERPVERPVPALVSPPLRAAAVAGLERNRKLAIKNTKRDPYLLRGLIGCECGRGYHGQPVHSDGKILRYYRCSAQGGSVEPDASKRCGGKRLAADTLENAVWRDCAAYIRNPGKPLAEARRQLKAQQRQAAQAAQQRADLEQRLAENAAGRERVLGMYRNKRITSAEAGAELDRTALERDQLQQLLAASDAQAALAAAAEEHLLGAATLLTNLQAEIDEIERTNDWGRKRHIVELLVHGLHVQTTGQGRGKRAQVAVAYTFGQTGAVENGTYLRTGPCAASPTPEAPP
jgi:site-specific DNA recombinase